ncbi:MAG: OmpH family outer membrane protein [Bacteroidaceae bacterium]|nr:OmpH family outer membrane protein [Bacteroidaceae bacterium]
MRKILLLLFACSPLLLMAQGRFGFYSHQEVLLSIPEYQQSIKEFEMLKQRCEAEIESNEQELTRKYVAFLDGQQDFPEPILRKRQNELQQMVDNSVIFRDRLKVWLSQAKDSLLAPHDRTVDQALAKVCGRMDLAYAINSDEIMYRYVNPKFGEEITGLVIEEIRNPFVEEVPVVECAEDEVGEEETQSEDESVKTVITDIATDIATDGYGVATDSVAVAADIYEAVTDSVVNVTEEVVDSIRVANDNVE